MVDLSICYRATHPINPQTFTYIVILPSIKYKYLDIVVDYGTFFQIPNDYI